MPDAVLAQLGNRIQHALRVYRPKEQRLVRAAADAFRPNPAVHVQNAITSMPIGEALVSIIESDGVPSPVERVRIFPPASQIGTISDLERRVLIEGSSLRPKYGAAVDEAAARRAFVDRERAARGLPPIDWSAEEWREGDYLNFIPNFEPQPPPVVRPRHGLAALLSLAAVGIFGYLLL